MMTSSLSSLPEFLDKELSQHDDLSGAQVMMTEGIITWAPCHDDKELR